MENESLKTELERAKEELRSKQLSKHDEDSGSGNKSAETHDTQHTTSTGVKVDKPAVVSKIVGGEEEDEDVWGDEWD